MATQIVGHDAPAKPRPLPLNLGDGPLTESTTTGDLLVQIGNLVGDGIAAVVLDENDDALNLTPTQWAGIRCLYAAQGLIAELQIRDLGQQCSRPVSRSGDPADELAGATLLGQMFEVGQRIDQLDPIELGDEAVKPWPVGLRELQQIVPPVIDFRTPFGVGLLKALMISTTAYTPHFGKKPADFGVEMLAEYDSATPEGNDPSGQAHAEASCASTGADNEYAGIEDADRLLQDLKDTPPFVLPDAPADDNLRSPWGDYLDQFMRAVQRAVDAPASARTAGFWKGLCYVVAMNVEGDGVRPGDMRTRAVQVLRDFAVTTRDAFAKDATTSAVVPSRPLLPRALTEHAARVAIDTCAEVQEALERNDLDAIRTSIATLEEAACDAVDALQGSVEGRAQGTPPSPQ